MNGKRGGVGRKGPLVASLVVLTLAAAALGFTLTPLRAYLPASLTSSLGTPGAAGAQSYIVAVLSKGDPEEEPGWYADNIFVVELDPAARKARAVIVPGTTKTMVPGVTFKQVRYAYAFGGGAALRDAVNRALRTDVEDYVVVADVTLGRAIDRLGGVPYTTKESVSTFIDEDYEVTPDGRQTLGGKRFRYLLYHYSHLPDIERGAWEQKELAKALLAAALHQRAFGGADRSTRWKGVETSLSPEELVSVSESLSGMTTRDLSVTLLPGSYAGSPVSDQAAQEAKAAEGEGARRVGWRPDPRVLDRLFP